MDIIEEIKRIANTAPADLTGEDKRFIKEQAKGLGLEFSPRNACKSCYIDMAVVIYRCLMDAKNASTEPAPATATESGEPESETRLWVLKEGVDVIWRNIRINKYTITDKKAEEYLRSGFPRKFFL